jgi:hypothetical protein
MEGSDHWVYFGDGNAARIVDSKEYLVKETGNKFTKFMFIPSALIEGAYDITELQDPSTHAVVMEYPSTEVLWLQRGVNRSRCWIFVDFMGGQTPASRRTEDLASTIRDTERLLRSAEAAKNRAYQELDVERGQQLQALKTKIDMVKEVAKARGRVDDESGMDTDYGMAPPEQ